MSRKRETRDLLVAATATVLVVALLSLGALIMADFSRALEPELERRSSLIGATVRDDVGRALALGIPPDQLVGLEAYAETLIDDFPELDFIAVRDPGGETLHGGGVVPDSVLDIDFEVPQGERRIVDDSIISRYAIDPQRSSAVIDIGIDASFVRSQLEDLGLDLLVIIIVALLVAYEVALSVAKRVSGRSTAEAGSLLDVRLVLFVYVVAQELNKSFLPQFVLSRTDPHATLDPALAVSLPIVAYLLTLGLASPFVGRYASRVGERRLLLLGFAISALSQVGMVFANEVWQITMLWGLTGVGYAISTIACLEYLIERRPSADRLHTMGTMVAVVIGGTFAGTAIGGILADRLGYQAVFAISALLIVMAALLAWRLLSVSAGTGEDDRSQAFSLDDVVAVLRQPRLLALLAGVTVPMNVLLAAFLWYLVPLTLAANGESAAVIARTLMLYYLAVLIATPAVNRLAGRWIGAGHLVAVGAIVSGIALLIPASGHIPLSVSAAVIVVGLGHAAIRGPQWVLAMELGERDGAAAGRGATLAVMRSLERLGGLAGLLVAALVVSYADLLTAIGAVGLSVAVAGAAYLATITAAQWSVRHA